MRFSSRTDYALRATLELAAHGEGTMTTAELGTVQGIPASYLGAVLADLRRAGIVKARRGPDGGWTLARPASTITFADVIRAIDGPLAGVSGQRPETLDFKGRSEPLREVWVAVRASLRAVLEQVTLADVAAGELPDNVRMLTSEPDAWVSH